MQITKRVKVPTGDILVVDGDHGQLELLSIGDYGKEVNLKCDAMGLGRAPSPVRHTALIPLEEKWVITISTQYGCSMGCKFCDVPKVGPGKNATKADLVNQVLTGLSLHPEVEHTNRLNIHFARMGEPSWNTDVLAATRWLSSTLTHKIHPVVSTMMPAHNTKLGVFLLGWMHIKNNVLGGEAGLQLSINSTDEAARLDMFNGNAAGLDEIGRIMSRMPHPKGRKITLNFAVAGWEIDPSVLLRYFDPEDYIIKLTPMHKTEGAISNGIHTEGDYTTYHPYQAIEESLIGAGYDVLVFIASEEEDLGRITCGNALLSGTMPECDHSVLVPGNATEQ